MQEFLKELIPSGIAKYPILAFIVAIWLFPSIRKLGNELSQHHAQLDFLKKRLEIAKLQCEIKTILSAHPELQLPSELFLPVPSSPTASVVDVAEQHGGVKAKGSAMTPYAWGFVGGIIPPVFRVLRLFGTPSTVLSPWPGTWGFILSLILFGILGAIAARTLKSQTPFRAVLTGASVPLGIGYAITGWGQPDDGRVLSALFDTRYSRSHA